MNRAAVLTLGLVASIVASIVADVGAQQQTPPTLPDSTPPATQAPPAGPKAGELVIQREVFTYSTRGRRDPMVSLMNSDDLRPLLQDIELMGIIFDPRGSGSQATFRDLLDAKKIYRVKVGQTLGRMTVSEITARDVEFTIDEFGFSRRERLLLKPDSTAARTP
jgi:hypothetical protein